MSTATYFALLTAIFMSRVMSERMAFCFALGCITLQLVCWAAGL